MLLKRQQNDQAGEVQNSISPGVSGDHHDTEDSSTMPGVAETLGQTADPEMQEFVNKYGDIQFEFIDAPPQNPWFTRPYALNYFHNGKLFRTRHERTSGRLELFLDLVYVGIAANLASAAIEEHTGASLGKYVLVFIPAWTIWADLKDFMNYYFNDDIIQRVFVLWILMLLVVYDNNCLFVDDLENRTPLLTSIVAYFLARASTGIIIVVYSFFIPEHRLQMRVFGLGAIIFGACWFFILLIHSIWGMVVFASLLLFIEQVHFCCNVHPWVKKNVMKLTHSTALNIEHEEERFHAFYIIALGEFLYSIVAGSPLRSGWNTNLAKGISVLVTAFMFMGIYASKDGSFKATHALRRSATTAMVFIYAHFVAIASLLIVGDAGAHLSEYEEKYLEEEDFGVLMFFHGGILIALGALTALSYADRDETPVGIHPVPKWARVGFRVPVGCLILGISWAYKSLTIVKIMWLDALFMILLTAYEFAVMNPWSHFYSPASNIALPSHH